MLCAMASVCLNRQKKSIRFVNQVLLICVFFVLSFLSTENVPNMCIMVNLWLKELMWLYIVNYILNVIKYWKKKKIVLNAIMCIVTFAEHCFLSSLYNVVNLHNRINMLLINIKSLITWIISCLEFAEVIIHQFVLVHKNVCQFPTLFGPI